MTEENVELKTETTNSELSAKKESSLSAKDILIPVSIVIAGLFVGGGMYFGGGQASPALDGVAAPSQVADTTDKVQPVTEDDHIKGSLNATIKIVEFSDFDCPFCSRFHDVMNSVVEKYSGEKVAWVYRQFPLEQLHPQAPAVALASECAAELGGNEGFWKFADGYMAARGAGDPTPHAELIPKIVLQAGISQTEFTECFDSGRQLENVQSDINQAVETGGRGTPWSIIIGPTGKTYPINGALPQQAVEQLIELALKEA